MPRQRSGSVVKRVNKLSSGKTVYTWWARVTYVDPVTGKRHDRQRRAESRGDAKDRIIDLIKELDATDGRALANDRKTFAELCDYMEKHYIKQAKYVDDRKVSGVRSLSTAKGQIKALREFFGNRRVRSITHGDLQRYKSARLNMPDKRIKEPNPTNPKVVGIATINRELSMLRKILNVAQREGWIIGSPFNKGDSIISVADEVKRERILTRQEEADLIHACSEPRCSHLKPLLICALDTGMRQGEMLSLRWSDIDFKHGLLLAVSFKGRIRHERQIAITARLALELERLWEASPKQSGSLVFGIKDNVKKSFETVRDKAKLSDVRFHDLRHTAATRLVGLHIPLSEVGRVLGHTQANTTYRYVNANIETARRAAAALDAFNAEGTAPTEPSKW